ncbi:molybdopterin-binding protein [Diplocloster hominis]|uniref:molybdopterin-binding protein n=1 Tax=Diplocloster hominis TaxID=3079010 RepID=UPI0031BA581F
MGTVKAICISDRRGIQKNYVEEAYFRKDWGIEGDAHAGTWHRQVSLLSHERIEEFRARGADVQPGAFGENLIVSGFDFRNLPVGTVFRCGEVLLEMTQIGKECHTHCQIYQKMGECIMPTQGVFARVLHEGTIHAGDEMSIDASCKDSRFTAAVITLSDKGAAGEREDQSGPLITGLLTQAGYRVIEELLLPDDQKKLENELIRLSDGRQASLILTTGGTGLSVRDVTPEATLAVAHRNVPGIAEAIRADSMRYTRRAMLSRGVSVIRGSSLIINLPGSPKAVRECLEFLLPELKHGVAVLKGSVSECGRR